jgi:hypothetical protein
MSERAGYRLTEESRPVLKGEVEIRLRRDKKPPKSAKTRDHLRLEIAQELELPASFAGASLVVQAVDLGSALEAGAFLVLLAGGVLIQARLMRSGGGWRE